MLSIAFDYAQASVVPMDSAGINMHGANRWANQRTWGGGGGLDFDVNHSREEFFSCYLSIENRYPKPESTVQFPMNTHEDCIGIPRAAWSLLFPGEFSLVAKFNDLLTEDGPVGFPCGEDATDNLSIEESPIHVGQPNFEIWKYVSEGFDDGVIESQNPLPQIGDTFHGSSPNMVQIERCLGGIDPHRQAGTRENSLARLMDFARRLWARLEGSRYRDR